MKPLVERLEKEYGDTIEFRLYNVEEDDAGIKIADQLGVQYVPTFVFASRDGLISNKLVGEQSEETMRKSFEALK